ncbi:MAG: DinB family protein [Anaerolineales bacterium]
MKKAISRDQTEENIKEVLRLLANSPVKMETLSKGLSDEQLHHPLGSGERSFIETVTHLINCEAITAKSVYLALLRDKPLVSDIHPERDLGKLLHFEQLPFSELLAYFKVRHTVLLRVLGSLNDKKWSRSVREEKKQREETIYWIARSQALHEMEHLLELEKKLTR